MYSLEGLQRRQCTGFPQTGLLQSTRFVICPSRTSPRNFPFVTLHVLPENVQAEAPRRRPLLLSLQAFLSFHAVMDNLDTFNFPSNLAIIPARMDSLVTYALLSNQACFLFTPMADFGA